MNSSATSPGQTSTRKLVVLLIDDQAIVGEAVRRMLADQPDIEFHYCQNPLSAFDMCEALQPTIILQDLVMPDIDGLTLVKFFRAKGSTRHTPLVVMSTKEEPAIKSEAFALGANDYLVKLPDKLELLARVRYHSWAYIHLLERNEAFEKLAANERQLAAEITAGANYVASLLPAPISSPLQIDWRFAPCSALGGDVLGYFPLDDDHFALYMIDVAGHGLGSALLGVTVSSVLRARALPGADFRQPNQVLAATNRSFQMENQNNLFFTMLYCVINHSTRKLSWSGAGHPPGLLFTAGRSTAEHLISQNLPIGVCEWDSAEQQELLIPEHSRLLIYTDGAFEIRRIDGTEWTFEEFLEFVSLPEVPQKPVMDRLFQYVKTIRGSDTLDDDFSILEVRF